jgi:hypothetical protein
MVGRQELGGLVRQLVTAAAALEGRMSAPDRIRFDEFKLRVDQVAVELDGLAERSGGR